MRWLLPALIAVTCLACDQTTIQIQNDLPNAIIEQARWVSDETGNAYQSLHRLEPGEATSEIHIFDYRDTDESGDLYFELVVGGNRVALKAREKVTAESYENTLFKIGPETKVGNPLLDADTAGE